jgi:hypothetical protein
MTEKEVEKLFKKGMSDADFTYPVPIKDRPYALGTLEDHWWSRGYSYNWRNYLRLDVEEKLYSLKLKSKNKKLNKKSKKKGKK